MSLPLPLVAVFLLQSVRVMHISRPQWRRKKQLTSTTTRSSSSAPRPRPTTVPSPRPLNRDSAKPGKRTQASERREKASLARVGFLCGNMERWGKRGRVSREDSGLSHAGPSASWNNTHHHLLSKITQRSMNSLVASWMDFNTAVIPGTSSLMYPWQKLCMIAEITPSRLQKQINFNRKFYSL